MVLGVGEDGKQQVKDRVVAMVLELAGVVELESHQQLKKEEKVDQQPFQVSPVLGMEYCQHGLLHGDLAECL